MTTRDKRKGFTFTWTLENVSYNWQKMNRRLILSPTFTANTEQKPELALHFYSNCISGQNNFIFCLGGLPYASFKNIDFELAIVSKAGAELESEELCKSHSSRLSIERSKIFAFNRSANLPENKIIVRCRIWEIDGEMAKDAHIFARTRICIKKEIFFWNIKNFSNRHLKEKFNYQIKSIPDDEVLMTLSLLLMNPYTDDYSINIQLVSENYKIKWCVLRLMPLNGFGNANQSIEKEFLFSRDETLKLFTLPFSKADLIAHKDMCLPNDELSFRCEYTYFTGDVLEEIESVIHGSEGLTSSEPDNQCIDEETTSSVSKHILNEDLKSLFHDNILSDIKLKVGSKTFSAHKNILSARSPVFKAMFSNNMKEKFSRCIEIEDFDSGTVFKMLHYIYTAEIQDLQLENACDLYRAADRYQILSLRDECYAYIKYSLSPYKACEVLILSDMQLNENLKESVQEYIFNHDILNSEEWKSLMKNHTKLAADTMHLQFQKTLKFPGNTFSVIEQLFGNFPKLNSVSSEFESTTTKTTPTSVLNSSDVGKPIQPSCSFGNYSTNKSPESSIFKTSSSQPPSAFPGLSNEEGSSLSASHGFSSNETVLFGMSASSGSNNISIPSASKGFNFSTTEKSSTSSFFFGNSGLKTSVKSSFSIGSNSEKETDKTSFSFGRSREKKQLIPSFSFGNNSEEKSVKRTFPLRSTCEKDPGTLCFSFKSSDEKESVKSPFTFGKSSGGEPAKSFFSFGNSSEKESVKPSFSFESTCEKAPGALPFSFSSNDRKESVKTSFSFGNSSIKEPVKPSFTSSDEKDSVESSFSFGKSSEKESVKPCFSNIDQKEPAKKSSANFEEKEPDEKSFVVSNQTGPSKLPLSFNTITEKEPGKEFLSLSISNETQSVKPLFSFSSISEKEPVKPSFLFKSNSEKQHVTPTFSFQDNSNKEPVKPFSSLLNSRKKELSELSSSFGSSDKKEHDKPSFSFGNNSEEKAINQFYSNSEEKESAKLTFVNNDAKESAKRSIFFANITEKEPGTKSFSIPSSNEKEPAKSTSFPISAEKEPEEPWFSFANNGEKEYIKESLSLAKSDEMEPVNPPLLFSSSSAETPSSSPRCNSGSGETPFEYPRLSSSSSVTKCAGDGSSICDDSSNSPATFENTVSGIDSIASKIPSDSTGWGRTSEDTSLASENNSAKIPSSSASDCTSAEVPSVSAGSDITSAETSESPGFDRNSTTTPEPSEFDSSNGSKQFLNR